VDRINKAGGNMPNTSGVPEEDFLPAAKMGVCKVNIDTDGRLVWTRVHREFFRDHPEKFDLRDPGKIYIEEYAKMIAHKNQALGSAGQLDDVRASRQEVSLSNSPSRTRGAKQRFAPFVWRKKDGPACG